MKPRLGLSPEELIETFNQMYLQSWGEVSEKLQWDLATLSRRGNTGEEADLGPFLLELMEAVVNACRDSTVLTIYENNERLAQELEACGVTLPRD
ncbi:MAG: hypothetical protein WC314_10925 [Vulcanimicrobiota bacterium]